MSAESGKNTYNDGFRGRIGATIENDTGYEGGPARIHPQSTGLTSSYFGSDAEIIQFVTRFKLLNCNF